MEDARRKIRMCLIFVVTLAVIIGLIYYFHDVRGNHGVNEGTLIKRMEITAKNDEINRMWINVRCFNIYDIPGYVWLIMIGCTAALIFLTIKNRRNKKKLNQ